MFYQSTFRFSMSQISGLQKFVSVTFSTDAWCKEILEQGSYFHEIKAEQNLMKKNLHFKMQCLFTFWKSWDARPQERHGYEILKTKFGKSLLTKYVHIYQIYRKEIMLIHGTFLCHSMFKSQDPRKPFLDIKGHRYFTCLYLPWL